MPLLNWKNLFKIKNQIILRRSLDCDSHLTIDERWTLYSLARNKSSIVEIGSYVGASACCFAAAHSSQQKTIYCIDTWTNEAMSEGSRNTWSEFRENTDTFSSRIVPLRGLSSEMASHLKRYTEKVDLLFIDGDHTYAGVKTDWESYKRFLTVGSVVVFHDVGWADGVKRIVNEEVKDITNDHGQLANMWWGTIAFPL